MKKYLALSMIGVVLACGFALAQNPAMGPMFELLPRERRSSI